MLRRKLPHTSSDFLRHVQLLLNQYTGITKSDTYVFKARGHTSLTVYLLPLVAPTSAIIPRFQMSGFKIMRAQKYAITFRTMAVPKMNCPKTVRNRRAVLAGSTYQ